MLSRAKPCLIKLTSPGVSELLSCELGTARSGPGQRPLLAVPTSGCLDAG